MSDNRFRLDGVEELRQAFRNLPPDATAEASLLIDGVANGAAVDIRAGYPVRTGNLRNHVIVTHFEQGRFGTGAIVKNTAKHAWVFENGSQARHTELGANRGAMPPGHVFIPAVIRARKRMYELLKRMLVSHGLIVSGEP